MVLPVGASLPDGTFSLAFHMAALVGWSEAVVMHYGTWTVDHAHALVSINALKARSHLARVVTHVVQYTVV